MSSDTNYKGARFYESLYRLHHDKLAISYLLTRFLPPYQHLTAFITRETTKETAVSNTTNTTVRNRSSVCYTLPVAQIACLVRLLVDIGAIATSNQRELMRQWTGMFRTNHTDSLSADSLRSKYYNIERSTAESTRALLLNMVHLSRKIIP